MVILAGVSAALHVGKLPPAIPTLQQALGLTLLQAAFLLSMVQGAGMCAGVAFGALADALGLKRSMLIGLTLIAIASLLGGALAARWRCCSRCARSKASASCSWCCRRRAWCAGSWRAERVSLMLGVWGAYMPLATASALLIGPLWIESLGWRAWWWLMAAATALMALWLARAVPDAAAAPLQALHHRCAGPRACATRCRRAALG